MAITPIFMDGFDDGIAGAGQPPWTSILTRGTVNVEAGLTGLCIRLRASASSSGDVESTCQVPVASKRFFTWRGKQPNGTTSGGSGPRGAWRFQGGTGGFLIWHNGTSWIMRVGSYANTGTVLATAPPSAQADWYDHRVYIEDGAPGRIMWWINGDLIYDGTPMTITALSQFVISAHNHVYTGALVYTDDFVVWGADDETIVPQVLSVHTLFPDGTSAAQGVGSDADSVDNHLLVDEATYSTADYVDLAAGERDTYALPALPFNQGIVAGVQVRLSAERTDAASITVAPVVKVGETEETLAAQEPGFGAVSHLSSVAATKPGGGPWTLADVNALELGVTAV